MLAFDFLWLHHLAARTWPPSVETTLKLVDKAPGSRGPDISGRLGGHVLVNVRVEVP